MTLKLTPQQAAIMNRYKNFTNAAKALEAAQKEATGSNEAIYYALSVAYYWYLQLKGNMSILQAELDSCDPKIKWPNSPKNPFTPIVKLVFGLDNRKYASRVITYARVLRFIDREVNDPALQSMYSLHFSNPELGKNIIMAGGGITDCAADQHAFENPPPKGQITQDKLERYLTKECQVIYSDRDAIDKVNITTNVPEGEFIVMMGRVGPNNDIEIVETLETSPTGILSLAGHKAFQDTSGLDARINLLADSLAFLRVFKAKDKPIVSVEQGGHIIRISLDRTHDASIVMTANLKEGNNLAAFPDRAYIAPLDYEWFLKNAQENKYRRLYKIASVNTKGNVETFELTNDVNKEVTNLPFNMMSNKEKKQVILDQQNSNTWQFEFYMDRDSLQAIYLGFIVGWKEEKKKKPEQRVINVNINNQGINLTSAISQPQGFPFKTHMATGFTCDFPIHGDELGKVIEEILANNNFNKITIRGLDTGVLEFVAEDSLAEYVIDIPTLASGFINHNNKHFSKLA